MVCIWEKSLWSCFWMLRTRRFTEISLHPDLHEINSPLQLLRGRWHLRHGVAGCRKRGEVGGPVIFSLCCQDPNQPAAVPVHLAAPEIQRAKRPIVQGRGKWNRFPAAAERALIPAKVVRQKSTMAA